MRRELVSSPALTPSGLAHLCLYNRVSCHSGAFLKGKQRLLSHSLQLVRVSASSPALMTWGPAVFPAVVGNGWVHLSLTHTSRWKMRKSLFTNLSPEWRTLFGSLSQTCQFKNELIQSGWDRPGLHTSVLSQGVCHAVDLTCLCELLVLAAA